MYLIFYGAKIIIYRKGGGFVQKSNERNPCYGEVETALKTAMPYLPPFSEIKYFLQCIVKNFLTSASENLDRRIVIMGSGLPEEIIYACQEKPHWVLGGSAQMAALADYAVPRDTDPISKSSLGFLLEEKEDSLIMIPLVNDSSRKLAYILESKGKQILTFSVPPVKSDAGFREYEHQVDRCLHKLGRYTKRIITRRALEKACRDVSNTYRQLADFEKLADEREDVVSGICRMLVFFSYYCAEDIAEWAGRLSALNARIRQNPKGKVPSGRARVLLAGSPIYFPNYKIPFLAQETGFQIVGCADYTALKLLSGSSHGKEESMFFGDVLKEKYYGDCSPAYPNNDAYFDAVRRMLVQKKPDGVIYHVLKGQIEYDFELNRLEQVFSEYGIPFIRLETDYNPQDIEQLRLRMEAFSEILHQKNWAGSNCSNRSVHLLHRP